MQRKLLLATILISLTFLTYGQQTSIRDAIYYFSLENGQLAGVGADTLATHIAASQFFLLGEEHDMAELSRFTAAVLPLLAKNGYHYFTLEIGPNSAEKLMSIYQHKESLHDFNTKYYRIVNDTPIPFFDGKEDETFLNQALRLGFELWGIDQENYYAPHFIFDELYNRSAGSERLRQLHIEASGFVSSEFTKTESNKRHPIYTNLLNSEEIKTFFQALPNDSSSRKLIKNLIISWKIYEAAYNNNWYSRIG